jgi:hypothetical protein
MKTKRFLLATGVVLAMVFTFSCSDDKDDNEPYDNGPENVFPRAGLWKLTGRDAGNTDWKADIVIENVQNNNFDGYFDWYCSPNFDYRGREYFTGQFNNNTDKVIFQGIRLENSINLALGKYEASVTKKRNIFYNGSWDSGGGVPSNDWQATWVSED